MGAEFRDAGEEDDEAVAHARSSISASLPRMDRLQMKVHQSDDSETPSTGRLSSPGFAPQSAELGALKERTVTLEAQLLQCAKAGQGLLAENHDLQQQVDQLREAQQLLQRQASELQGQLEAEKQRSRSSRQSSRRQSRRWSRESSDEDVSVRGDLARRASTATRKSQARSLSSGSGHSECSRPPPRKSTRSAAVRRHGSVDSLQSSGEGEDDESRACVELRRQLDVVEDTNSELLSQNTQLHEGMQRLEREVQEARARAAEAERCEAEAARAAEAERSGDETLGAPGPARAGGLARFKKAAFAVRFAVDTPSRAAARLRRASSNLSDSGRRFRRTSSTLSDAPTTHSEDDEESGDDEDEKILRREEELEGQARDAMLRCETAEREVGHLVERCSELEMERDQAQELWREEAARSAALASEVEQLRAKLDEKDAEASALLMERHRRKSLAADLSGARRSLQRADSSLPDVRAPPADPLSCEGGATAVEDGDCSDEAPQLQPAQGQYAALRSALCPLRRNSGAATSAEPPRAEFRVAAPPPSAPPPSPSPAALLEGRAGAHAELRAAAAPPPSPSPAAHPEGAAEAPRRWQAAAAAARKPAQQPGRPAFEQAFPIWSQLFASSERLAMGPLSPRAEPSRPKDAAPSRPQWMKLFADAGEALS